MSAGPRWPLWLGALAAAAAATSPLACQLIADIEDKTLVEPEVRASRGVPPRRPSGDRRPSGTDKKVVLAAKEFFYGTRQLNDKSPDVRAWRQLGFDLDGVCTGDNGQPAGCQLAQGRTPSLLEDGEDCRDNSYGRNLATSPSVTLGVDFDNFANPSVNDGTAPTYVFVLDDYDDGPDDPFVPATLYVTVPLAEPAEAPDDLWRPDAERPVDRTKAYRFQDGYRRGTTWVSGDREVSRVRYPVPFLGSEAEVLVDMVLITLDLGDGGRAGAIGNFGYAARAEEMQAKFEPIGVEVIYNTFTDPEAPPDVRCTSARTLVGTILQSLALNSDMPQLEGGGSPANALSPCSAISVGIGFQAVSIRAAVEVEAPNPPELNCPPLGMGGAGGAGGEGGGDGDENLARRSVRSSTTVVLASRSGRASGRAGRLRPCSVPSNHARARASARRRTRGAQPASRKGSHSGKGWPIAMRMRAATVQRGREGARRRGTPASSGVREPFRRLHERQAVTRLSQLSAPPRLRGTMWSMFRSRSGGRRPQYWH